MNVVLVETKVKLTPIYKEESLTLFRWINDAETVRYNNAYRPVSCSSHEAWFEGIGKDPSRVIFGIRSLDDGRLVGTVQLSCIHPVYRSAEFSIRIGEPGDRNRGFGSMATRLAIDFAFKDLNLSRISLHVFADNDRAINLYKKMGFIEEGRLRRAAYIHGKWVDIILMAVLADIRSAGSID